NGILHDPWKPVHMGITAENVAERYGITRDMQDTLALERQRRAAVAIVEGYFKDQIVPVQVKTKGGTALFDTEEHVRTGVTMESLAAMKPAFRKDGGTVTAGNAS
ncbi:acetyl-CoA C-acyltransferase, partial [Aromatoleum toluclasticum]|nr:acetyl-CoA C-acyltransferase [Aromatoleum toluclasticum]